LLSGFFPKLLKMSFWRQAGLNYIQYSSISARLTRKALKPQFKADALKREDVNAKVTQWKDGKPVSQKA